MQQQTEFAIIPDRHAIEKLDREIRFFPSTTSQPRALTRDQIEQWNQNGYLAPLEALDLEAVLECRQYFDRLLDEAFAAGRDSYSISSAHLKHRRVWDLLCHPHICAMVTDLLGPNVIGWGSHFFCKLPGDGKRVDWHQDCSYWPLTPAKSVTVWLAIDDADLENGCMEVVVGSQKYGLFEFAESDAESGNVLNQTVTDPEKYGTLQATPLRAGQMSIHSDQLLHGSAPNTSQRRRCGLTLRYCPADVTALLGWNKKGVVVAGDANPQLWPGAERPEQD